MNVIDAWKEAAAQQEVEDTADRMIQRARHAYSIYCKFAGERFCHPWEELPDWIQAAFTAMAASPVPPVPVIGGYRPTAFRPPRIGDLFLHDGARMLVVATHNCQAPAWIMEQVERLPEWEEAHTGVPFGLIRK